MLTGVGQGGGTAPDRQGAIFFEAPLNLAISSGGLGGGQIRRVETGHNRMRVLS